MFGYIFQMNNSLEFTSNQQQKKTASGCMQNIIQAAHINRLNKRRSS